MFCGIKRKKRKTDPVVITAIESDVFDEGEFPVLWNC